LRKGRIIRGPKHLGKGWPGFDFARALGKPARVINDAAMQALGSYHGGGRMLFLGLGTGLGSALVWERTLLPLELGDLPYPENEIIENYLGVPGVALLGGKKWKREVIYAVIQLSDRLSLITLSWAEAMSDASIHFRKASSPAKTKMHFSEDYVCGKLKG